MSVTPPGAAPSGQPPRGPVCAVVPLRDGVSGKSRLAEALDAPARRRLVVALARHVLQVVTGAAGVDRVVVVTADPAFVREVLPPAVGGSVGVRLPGRPTSHRTTDLGVEVLPEPPGRHGLNAALEHARARLRAGEDAPGRLLVVHADLPLLTTDDVAAVLAAPTDVVVATDRHGTGTNLLALPAPAVHVPSGEGLPFRFGPGSRAAHEAEAAALGLTCAVVQRPGTATDVDTTDDLAALGRPAGA